VPPTASQLAAPTPIAAVATPVPFDTAAAYAKGVSMAEEDIRHGQLKLKTYGRQFGWADDYAKTLKRRYGIEVVAVAGCMILPDVHAEADGYNAVATARIEQRFGRGVLDRVSRETERRYWRRHPPESN
jgi:hypothetical protein